MLARIIRIIFGGVAGIMLVAALGDVVIFGRLTIVTPFSFGALLAVAMNVDPAAEPEFNEHGDQILTDLLGYDWDTVVDFKVKGAVE